MSPHKKIYFDFYGLEEGDFIPDAIDGSPAVDVHAICSDGMGGSDRMHRIENLIPLSRGNHKFYGDKRQYKAMLYKLVLVKLVMENKDFDMDWLFHQIKKYEQ